MKKEQPFKVGDTVICMDGTDSFGFLKKNAKYEVRETDGIRVALKGVPLTWANIRFELSK